jgi:hypothetical protein
MIELVLDAKGTLDTEEEALEWREKLNMDEIDSSEKPIVILTSPDLVAVTPEFGMAFLQPTAYKIWDSIDDEAQVRGLFKDMTDQDFNAGPYSFAPQDGVETTDFKRRVRHRLFGCLLGLYSNWELDRGEQKNNPENKLEH